MNIRIDDALRACTDPLTPGEYAALERSILAEGCRDALVLWRDVLIDGHNRYAICQKHGIAFKTIQNDNFASIDDVMLWMLDNHLARRSVTDFQRGMFALRKKAILAARLREQQEKQAAQPPVAQEDAVAAAAPAPVPAPPPLATREEVAKAAGISSNAISRIEKIQKTATPELVEAVRTGAISLNAAAAVASLPSAEQVAAVAAGKKELQQVARQVREAKAPPRPAKVTAAQDELATPTDGATLAARVEQLTVENAALKARVAELTAALEEARRAQ